MVLDERCRRADLKSICASEPFKLSRNCPTTTKCPFVTLTHAQPPCDDVHTVRGHRAREARTRRFPPDNTLTPGDRQVPVATLRQTRISEPCQRQRPAPARRRAWRPGTVAPGNVRRRPTREKPRAPCGSGGAQLKAHMSSSRELGPRTETSGPREPNCLSVDPSAACSRPRWCSLSRDVCNCRSRLPPTSLGVAPGAHGQRTLCDERTRFAVPPAAQSKMPRCDRQRPAASWLLLRDYERQRIALVQNVLSRSSCETAGSRSEGLSG